MRYPFVKQQLQCGPKIWNCPKIQPSEPNSYPEATVEAHFHGAQPGKQNTQAGPVLKRKKQKAVLFMF